MIKCSPDEIPCCDFCIYCIHAIEEDEYHAPGEPVGCGLYNDEKHNNEEVETEEGEDGRWTRGMDTIFKLGEDEYWCIPWRKGLTEYQEDEFWDDPYRVEKRVETVQIETWVPLK